MVVLALGGGSTKTLLEANLTRCPLTLTCRIGVRRWRWVRMSGRKLNDRDDVNDKVEQDQQHYYSESTTLSSLTLAKYITQTSRVLGEESRQIEAPKYVTSHFVRD
jgi:hypothetical protein